MTAALLSLAVTTLSAALVVAGVSMAQPDPDGPVWALWQRAVLLWFGLTLATVLLGTVALLLEVA